jgi:hypothetical protein
MIVYYCGNCRNRTKFLRSATERHEWRVDKYGQFVSDVECYDSEPDETVRCAKCGDKAMKAEEGEREKHGRNDKVRGKKGTRRG